jgi:hypothetical protein
MHKAFTVSIQIFAQNFFFHSFNHSFKSDIFAQSFFFLSSQKSQFQSRQQNHLLAQGQTQGSTLQQRTNKTLTTSPFGNTCEADEVSPEVEAGVVAGLRCLQP